MWVHCMDDGWGAVMSGVRRSMFMDYLGDVRSSHMFQSIPGDMFGRKRYGCQGFEPWSMMGDRVIPHAVHRI